MNRRSFLKGMGIGLGVAVLAPLSFLKVKPIEPPAQEEFYTSVEDIIKDMENMRISPKQTISATKPNGTYPYQLWANTKDGHLYIRNGENTKWFQVLDGRRVNV